ncbi:uncharacterized protein N7529_010815 [Penicillium soppii]|uniref:uncharacterized protein n=1 Tax=Penicillium soppii TaxID=69789 RepID=UPI0025467373|nr:uncharacterized protein N7529_010815 [Penicillium soppii]KAJ5851430.1 hypothetical protein N7529_010815 [Penicillium soppii]
MTSPEYSSHFSLANIPFGVASSQEHPSPRCVTRLENTVIFLDVLQQTGAFAKVAGLPNDVFDQSTLNEFATLPKSIQREVRTTLQVALTKKLPPNSTEDVSAVTLHMPVSVGGFTDFSCSLHHVRNAGRAILNDETPPPGFFNFPIGYNGRASTLVVSGTPIVRPKGHTIDRAAATEKKPISFGPSKAMDYELEVGVIVGKPVPRVQGVNARDADEHIFGMVILNDWSARDIQGCEMVPLGPMNSKAFGTTISPWVVTLDALESFKAPGPTRDVILATHLEDIPVAASSYNIGFKVELLVDGQPTTLSRSNFKDLHWSGRQMVAHIASSGADLQTGDILGTGTVSGPEQGSYGCLLEMTNGGKEPMSVADGPTRVFLEDGDVIRMTALAGEEDSGVGFGECVGELQPAL